ncbi:MAG: small-conductance mechanosensitive channel-like protein [Proteobacteria bacterium]|nr:MAG: small-conductance mechanosensitive channel-like protein [Pseudomonadota bacterium]
MPPQIDSLIERLLGSASVIELVLWVSCVLLILFSRIIFTQVFHLDLKVEQNQNKLKIFRITALLVIVTLLLNQFIFNANTIGAENGTAKKLVGVVMILFSAYWSAQILQFVIRRQYGRVREVSGEKVFSESYNSRFLSLLVVVLVFVFALIGIVQLLGFDSLLEASGFIGVIGVSLALTQGAWAPDIISGLIILNSNAVEEGDVIQLDDGAFIGRVFRTRLFHTELLNLANNSRLYIKNAKLRDASIHNLSKFASVRGYRQGLSFKIGYDTPPEQVRAMFQEVYESAVSDEAIPVESGHELEIRVTDTGDDAVEWSVFYYTKEMASVIKTRQLFMEKVLNQSIKRGISLATPDLYQRVEGGAVGEPGIEGRTI